MSIDNELPDIFKQTSSNAFSDGLEQQALDVIANMSKQYIEWVSRDVARLKELFAQIQKLSGKEQDDLIRGDFYRTAHDIKGQGATFDYPLMSDLGAHVCALIKMTDAFNETHLDAFSQDIKDMSVVLEKQLQGDGGQVGALISKRLKNG